VLEIEHLYPENLQVKPGAISREASLATEHEHKSSNEDQCNGDHCRQRPNQGL
jgi:hypothetical protein